MLMLNHQILWTDCSFAIAQVVLMVHMPARVGAGKPVLYTRLNVKFAKNPMQAVCRIHSKDDKCRSDTFPKYVAAQFPKDATAQQLRENLDLDALQQGNPLSCVKTFKMLK